MRPRNASAKVFLAIFMPGVSGADWAPAGMHETALMRGSTSTQCVVPISNNLVRSQLPVLDEMVLRRDELIDPRSVLRQEHFSLSRHEKTFLLSTTSLQPFAHL